MPEVVNSVASANVAWRWSSLFLLISTAIIVAFLIRARFGAQARASYSTSIQSDLLAAGAVDNIVAQFTRSLFRKMEQAGSAGSSF